ncbi:clustered mitochondria protein homolog [Tetranychus urticae]|uniref:clustered mitochondria protein homolog n=1 Tax=Tetranychus urticae TaxID=32264 RepID=UPI00077BA215|nr:clustered mitochondria protein homolog [Tetranychus urticae]
MKEKNNEVHLSESLNGSNGGEEQLDEKSDICSKTLTKTSSPACQDSLKDNQLVSTEKDEKEKTGESKSDQEFIFIHDTCFNVTISSPGKKPFDIQVSPMEMVQEIHHLLMDREDTCHRTCFSLQLDGNTLDNFAELKNVEGLKEGSVLEVVKQPYTVREARIHIRHIRDLLKSLDTADAYNGLECNSLSFLNIIAQGDIFEKKKGVRPDSVDCTPPDFILPGNKDRPLLALQPQAKEQKGPQALKVMTTSGWNPPPGWRKLQGDILYLYVVTLEDKRYHITASTHGFFVNQSTEEVFNPKPVSPKVIYHSLIDLLDHLSPLFKKNFIQIQKKKHQKHLFERVATPYQMYSWTAPFLEHTVDYIRAEDAFSSKLGYEEHIPGQTRDWNEELQTTRELPRKTLPERLLRERAIFKVHSDFVAAATRGAMAVIDGNVMAINPGEDPKMQMFIWNNIFFSLGFDVRDHYKELGGDAAAYVAPNNDLQGVKAYSAVDVEGLHTLGTVVIDYRGHRVTAQSIIPGILEREQEQSVVYGSVDFGKTVVTHPKYLELLGKAGQVLKIVPHKVLNEKDEEVEICSSVECKGIIGNDGRHYILDLLRTFPPDVNFFPLSLDEYSDDVKSMGYPRSHRHKLCCLRQELVDAFVEAKYMMFIKLAAYHLQQSGLKRLKENASYTNGDATNNEASDVDQVKNDAKGDQLKLHNGEAHDLKVEIEIEKDEDKQKSENSDDTKKFNDIKKMDIFDKGDELTSTTHSSSKSKSDFDNLTLPSSPSEQLKNSTSSASNDYPLTEENNNKTSSGTNNEDISKILENITAGGEKNGEETTQEIVCKAAKAVKSLKENEFDIRFNPDVYSPTVRHVSEEGDELKNQRQLVKDAAEFLLTVQISTFIRDCLENTTAPFDGVTLAEALHARGINIRYLGTISKKLEKFNQLQYLQTIVVTDLLCRSAKHIYTSYLQEVDMMNAASAIAHFLNCFLSSCQSYANKEEKPAKRKGKKRGNGRQNSLLSQYSNEWSSLTPKSLFDSLLTELESYYGWETEATSIDQLISLFNLQKVSILRSFCMKTGIQILLREYNMDSRNKSSFTEDDILNVFPVVKHINPRASDAYNFYTTGQTKIQQGYLKEGYELISEALNLLNNVYGAMHPEIAQCLRMLARLNYIMGDHSEAMACQQKAVLMSEKVNGVDHPSTITEYSNLALYCFANSQVTIALKLLYRARYLCLLVCGEDHPEIAILDSNIGLILHSVGEYELSLRFLTNALDLNIRFSGKKSLKVALSYHLVARTQSCIGDFRGALQNERETWAIYKLQLGDNHEKTKESSECLRHLTQQAVLWQKRMNEIYKGDSPPMIPPIQIQPPFISSVLETLNIINGIIIFGTVKPQTSYFDQETD